MDINELESEGPTFRTFFLPSSFCLHFSAKTGLPLPEGCPNPVHVVMILE